MPHATIPDMEIARPNPFILMKGGKIWDKNGTGDKEHRKHHQHAVLIPDTPEAE